MMQDLRIAAVQMNCRVAEHDRNLATIERFAEAAAAQDVDIVCFPELCVCGYNAGDTSTPEPEPLEGGRPGIARWLRDPENVESLVESILKALEAYAGQANWLKSLIANLGLHFFREEITQALHQRIPQLAREFLHSEEVREKFAKQLIDSVNDLLRRPVAEVVGEHRHILAQRVGFYCRDLDFEQGGAGGAGELFAPPVPPTPQAST